MAVAFGHFEHDTATVTATAAPGFQGLGWTLDGVQLPDGGRTVAVPVTGDRTVVARFGPVGVN